MSSQDPEFAQPVMLDVIGQGKVPARVEESGDAHLRLALVLSDSEDLVRDEHGAVIEFTSRRGLHRIEGFVRGTEAPDVLDFERRRGPEVIQRRDFARAQASVPVRLWIGEDEVKLHTLNVSGNGMLVHAGQEIEIGDEFWFEIDLEEGSAPLSGRATVVREHDSASYGVAIDLSERGRDRLVHYVFERQRRDLLVRGS